MAAAIRRAVHDAFGGGAHLVLADPSWDISDGGPSDGSSFPVGEHGTLTVPSGVDGSVFARELAARLTDFETLERERGRSARLGSLYEAAQEFSSGLDIESTLDTIVRRGKALTGSDICYLSMNDLGLDETYICATAGVRTEGFKCVRLRYGYGLGGLIARDGRPYYSSDYLHDDRFAHVVDSAVEAEGMVSVMAVPLKLGDCVIGVLYAGNRHLSSFGEEDVAFLESLADHAAIAIENARLYGRLERAQLLHRRLTDLVLTEQPIEVLQREIGEALGLTVRILEGPVDEDSLAGGTVAPVRAGPVTLGALVVESEGLDEEKRAFLEQAANVVAVHLLKERAVIQAVMHTRGELLEAILSGSMPAEALARRAAVFDLDLVRSYRVIVAPGDQGSYVARRHPRAFITTRLGNTVMLLADGVPLPELPLAGCSRPVSGIAGIAEGVAEATRVLQVAQMLKRSGLVRSDDLGVYSLLLGPRRADEAVAQARALLAPVLDYDEVHGSDLLPTLEAFLEAQGSPAKAARRLYLHVNSLYYRLGRIGELSGWDLEDPEVRIQLQLAYRILRMEDQEGA